MENNWYSDIEQTVFDQKDKIYHRDLRFYQVDRFLKMAQISDLHADSCAECRTNKDTFSHLASGISDFLSGNMRKRRDYEKNYDRINQHLQKVHGYFPQQYFLSMYTFYGLLLGALPGFAFYFLTPGSWVYFFSVVVMISIFVARQFGKKKDKLVKKAGKEL